MMEVFHSIQGEGFHQGKSAGFVRLGGCDVGCHWCDVKASWEADQHPLLSIDEITETVAPYTSEIVIVTGGEPVMYDLGPLTNGLRAIGKKTHLETSGTSLLTGNWDWITFSPKKFKAPLDEYFEKADELKVIVFNNSDLKWAEGLANRVKKDCRLYLQPEWDKREEMTPGILSFIQSDPRWRLSLQVHKYLGVR